MNQTVKRIGNRILPTRMKNDIRKLLLRINQNKRRREYERICGEYPGYIALPLFRLMKLDISKTPYNSQFFQDYIMDNCIFMGKKNGFFLDVGGNDPIKINNTYYFEKNMGWDGIAFEPLPELHKKWEELRNVECIQAAVGSKKGRAEFVEYDDGRMSGLSECTDYKGAVENSYFVEVVTITDVLTTRGISHVDFMSIDIEGAELDALKGIDFQTIKIDYIVIENNKGKKKEKEIRDFLLKNGYIMIARLWIDDIWKKEN